MFMEIEAEKGREDWTRRRTYRMLEACTSEALITLANRIINLVVSHIHIQRRRRRRFSLSSMAVRST